MLLQMRTALSQSSRTRSTDHQATTLPLCSDGRVYVRNLKHVPVTSLQEALEAMKEGARNKMVRRSGPDRTAQRNGVWVGL